VLVEPPDRPLQIEERLHERCLLLVLELRKWTLDCLERVAHAVELVDLRAQQRLDPAGPGRREPQIVGDAPRRLLDECLHRELFHRVGRRADRVLDERDRAVDPLRPRRPRRVVPRPFLLQARQRTRSLLPGNERRERARDRVRRHLLLEQRRRGVLEVVALVEHEAIEPRQHAVAARHSLEREVREHEVVVHDEDVRGRRAPPRSVVEAAIEVRTARAERLVVVAADRLPELVGDRLPEVLLAPFLGRLGERRERLEERTVALAHRWILDRLRELAAAEVVAPALEECRHRGNAEPLEDRDVTADELLLEGNRVGRDRDLRLVGDRPERGGHQVGERLPGAGARLEHGDASLVQRLGDGVRHRHLALPRLVAGEHLGESHAEDLVDLARGDLLPLLLQRLHDPQCPLDRVVHDHEADAVLAVERGEVHVGARRLHHPVRVVVDDDVAGLRSRQECRNGPVVAATMDLDVEDLAARIEPSDREDLDAAGIRDRLAHAARGLGLEARLGERLRHVSDPTRSRATRDGGNLSARMRLLRVETGACW
jgi:hypothetical protein